MMTDRILRLLFPPRCTACQSRLDWYTCERSTVLCRGCQAKLESERLLTCDRCAKRIDQCRCMPPLLSRAGCRGLIKLVSYYPNRGDYVQNRLLYTVKRYRAPRVHQFLAEQLFPMLEQHLKTCEGRVVLTYLPRNRRSLRMNGTDQARMLAMALSKKSGIPMKTLLVRTRGGNRAQKKLSRRERIRNADALFALAGKMSLKGVTVILVDDLVTTGSSMAAAIRILRQTGAKEFFGVSVAVDA